MSRMRLIACITLAASLWGPAALAQPLDAARTAFEEGRFAEASELAAAVGTSGALALAAETLAIHGFHVAKESERQALFQRAQAFAEEAIRLDDTNTEAHLQLSHAMGRYAETLGKGMKALGLAKPVCEAMERAVALAPDLGRAHLSLASWHAEASGNLTGRMMTGASKKKAAEHFERAYALAPADKAVQVEYAKGLLALNKRRNRERARELFTQAAETPPRDAYEAILREQAREGLAALDAS